ncbi:DUF4058 family protein [Argonema antarcticum]|uniref:DUF4058 family protein n=1 Tax=Argonema antarcticum TaxID=2942763 RepID=UPI00201115B1|nr:DUF4058 family protein [Argonema antarcticum]MCL1473409.1 DUF4058 family protein [Argonema antarcticum A004/B2]
MPSPFPGMNPYLENPQLWPAVHHRLIVAISDALVPQLLPKYLVDIEKRVYQIDGEDSLLVGIPDVTVQRFASQTTSPTSNVAVAATLTKPLQVTVPMPMEFREGYLEVREIATKEVVTVIEVLSPTNKRTGQGREIYDKKRQQVLASRTHLVEIDLLRGGQPMPVFGNNIEGSYRILVSRGNRRPRAELYVFNLPDEIPAFPLPLRTGDVEPVVDLQALIGGVYDRAGYDFVIDYSGEPVPPLSETDAAWTDGLLREKGLR